MCERCDELEAAWNNAGPSERAGMVHARMEQLREAEQKYLAVVTDPAENEKERLIALLMLAAVRSLMEQGTSLLRKCSN